MRRKGDAPEPVPVLCSSTAVEHVQAAAREAGIPEGRLQGITWDLRQGPGPLSVLGADVALLVFTLSALHPREMPTVMQVGESPCALRPGRSWRSR